MGREEQVEEREVLDSIFPKEIKDIDETSYIITIALDTPEEDGPPPSMLLTVRYPEAYPDTAPSLSLSSPPDLRPHPYFNLSDDKAQLLKGVDASIEESIGMAMIFTLVSALKEAAEELVQRRRDTAIKAHEEAILEAERRENAKFHGDPVTKESFMKWREGFMREMEESRLREEDRAADMKKKNVKEVVKLTGRELWERGLAGKGDVEDDVVDGVENLKV